MKFQGWAFRGVLFASLFILPIFSQAKNSSKQNKLTCPISVAPEKELLIRDLSVVNDPVRTGPGGAWNFGTLMREMTPVGKDPAEFVENWINEWSSVTSINGFNITTRDSSPILNAWPRVNGHLDLDHPPFRLLALVYRPDKTSPKTGGQGKLAYGFLANATSPASFLVIFEYGLPLNASAGLTAKSWAAKWHALGEKSFGADFNAALEEVTNLFTRRGSAPENINGNALDQLRTNEVFLAPSWELREFNFNAQGEMRQSLTKQTPAGEFNDFRSAEMIQWITDNASFILNGTHVVPDSMLSGNSIALKAWLPSLNQSPDGRILRAKFAKQTCNGCHTSETNTSFTHIDSRAATEIAPVSAFLLNELPFRTKLMQTILDPNNCGKISREEFAKHRGVH